MDRVYFENHLPVGGFVWIENLEENSILPDAARPPFITYKNNDCLCKVIHPLEKNPLLYRELANLYPSKENITSFAKKYGLLRRENGEIIDKHKNVFKPACSYSTWIKSIIEMHCMVFLLDLIKNEDDVLASKILHITENGQCALVSAIIPVERIGLDWYKDLVKIWPDFMNGDDSKVGQYQKKYPDVLSLCFWNTTKRGIEVLKHLFRFPWEEEVYKKLKALDNSVEFLRYLMLRKISEVYENGLSVNFLVDIDTKVKSSSIGVEKYLVPEDLYTALFVQLEMEILNTRELRQCEYCGDWFIATDKRRKYCPEFIEVVNPYTGEVKKVPTGKHCKVYAYRQKNKGISS